MRFTVKFTTRTGEVLVRDHEGASIEDVRARILEDREQIGVGEAERRLALVFRLDLRGLRLLRIAHLGLEL